VVGSGSARDLGGGGGTDGTGEFKTKRGVCRPYTCEELEERKLERAACYKIGFKPYRRYYRKSYGRRSYPKYRRRTYRRPYRSYRRYTKKTNKCNCK
jgi:hypothetical protein